MLHLVKSGRLRIARIEGHATDDSPDSAVGEETLQERNARDVPQAVLIGIRRQRMQRQAAHS